MKVLINSAGNALTKNGRIIATKPYSKLWGYALAKSDGTIDVYDWIYRCFEDGFSVGARTVNGASYTVDAGDASAYMEGFRWLTIPMIQFNIEDSEGSRRKIRFHFLRVIQDNPVLCYYIVAQNPVYYLQFTSVEGKIETVKMVAPNDNMRRNAQIEIDKTVAVVKDKVLDICGVAAGDTLTATQKRNVTKCLHDWLMDHTTYSDNKGYWSHTMFSALDGDATYEPVCDGYSLALQYLCNLYGINCVYVAGSVDADHLEYENHAWNMVSFVLPIGKYDNDEYKWSAVDLTYDDGRYDGRETRARIDWWGYFCTDKVYHHNNDSTQTRWNSPKGYPVSIPAALYPYNGNTLYGIAEEDWEQGGDAE